MKAAPARTALPRPSRRLTCRAPAAPTHARPQPVAPASRARGPRCRCRSAAVRAVAACGPERPDLPGGRAERPDLLGGRAGAAGQEPPQVLRVQLLSGSVINLELPFSSATIGDVKKELMKHTGVGPSQQRLVHAGKALPQSDTTTLAQLNVRPGDELVMVTRLRGG
ncbi:Ubiquitin-60S ribosomal protein L40 [Tetrabaena socialis]|uniref:Ubiquitin-60S ribosomal protein L40 n=1 Tax=Tetrabaena socialis TaxID=47790 RepID=A0A2J8ACQ0_9CHLO|nr:Ubiquitin-60S ribosomal protein L40 [Tetrabaena socialis]|eukprot:PNH10292.1 Ubiquitin-60S ribosomal protein L40 [Tetrabaena socialis]